MTGWCERFSKPGGALAVYVLQMCGFKKSRFFGFAIAKLLGAGVLRNCFRSLADCVLRKFSREQKTHRSLDFARR